MNVLQILRYSSSAYKKRLTSSTAQFLKIKNIGFSVVDSYQIIKQEI